MIQQSVDLSLDSPIPLPLPAKKSRYLRNFAKGSPGTYMSTTAFMFVWTLHRMLRSGEIEAKTWATFED